MIVREEYAGKAVLDPSKPSCLKNRMLCQNSHLVPELVFFLFSLACYTVRSVGAFLRVSSAASATKVALGVLRGRPVMSFPTGLVRSRPASTARCQVPVPGRQGARLDDLRP